MEYIPILKELADKLGESFESDRETRRKFEDYHKDLLVTYLCLTKNEKGFRRLIESSSISEYILTQNFNMNILGYCIEKKFVIRCQTPANVNEYHISAAGIYNLQSQGEVNLESLFVELDRIRLPELSFKLKSEEIILCLFLFIVGADSKENGFILKNTELEKNSFEFLKKIEETLLSKGISFRKKITFGKGKKINFRKFITENVDLPKTELFHSFNSSNIGYYLDLSTRQNIVALLDLILFNYSEHEKVIKKRVLFNELFALSNNAFQDLGGEITPPLNEKLKNELRS
jgi:hypothetical protein